MYVTYDLLENEEVVKAHFKVLFRCSTKTGGTQQRPMIIIY